MTAISANELREKSVDELKQILLSSLDEQFKLRMQASSSEQQIQPHLVKEARRSVARIKTVLNEKHLGEKKSPSTVNVKEGD